MKGEHPPSADLTLPFATPPPLAPEATRRAPVAALLAPSCLASVCAIKARNELAGFRQLLIKRRAPSSAGL